MKICRFCKKNLFFIFKLNVSYMDIYHQIFLTHVSVFPSAMKLTWLDNNLIKFDKSHLDLPHDGHCLPNSLRLSPIKMKIILYSLLLAGAVRAAFHVSKVTPKEIRVKEGHPFKIICTTNKWYEVSLTTLVILHVKLILSD